MYKESKLKGKGFTDKDIIRTSNPERSSLEFRRMLAGPGHHTYVNKITNLYRNKSNELHNETY